jgi:hypothetical protein
MSSSKHPNEIDFVMPSPRMIREYTRDLDEVDGCLTNALIHEKCGTSKEFDSNKVLDELKWMREHYHECAGEIYHAIDSGVCVKVRLLENGQTELYVRNNRDRTGNWEITKTALLYPVKDTDKKNDPVTIDIDEMRRD